MKKWGLKLCLLLISASACCGAPPAPPLPPEPLVAGPMHDGTQIALWSEKATYSKGEFRNVWVVVRKSSLIGESIGVNGSLYRKNTIYVMDQDGKLVTKFVMPGPIDGAVHPTHFSAGIAGLLRRLPFGTYTLTWKTKYHTSNTLSLTFTE